MEKLHLPWYTSYRCTLKTTLWRLVIGWGFYSVGSKAPTVWFFGEKSFPQFLGTNVRFTSARHLLLRFLPLWRRWTNNATVNQSSVIMSVSLKYLLLPVNELWTVSGYGKKIFEYSSIFCWKDRQVQYLTTMWWLVSKQTSQRAKCIA